MWENQIGGYSDIQKCGKMMSVDVCGLSLNHPLISIKSINGSTMDTPMDPQETSQHVRYSFNMFSPFIELRLGLSDLLKVTNVFPFRDSRWVIE